MEMRVSSGVFARDDLFLARRPDRGPELPQPGVELGGRRRIASRMSAARQMKLPLFQ